MSAPERDPYTGLNTTGHEWNGIKELQTPIPKIVWISLLSATAIAVFLWFLFPTWPLGKGYTPGLLGVDQKTDVEQALHTSRSYKHDWESRILASSPEDITANEDLKKIITQHGNRLFQDNCAACHGADAEGKYGYPSLVDNAWLWGGDLDAIEETLRVGINSGSDETRYSQMMAFGKDGFLEGSDIKAVAAYVKSLSLGEVTSESQEQGKLIFADQCASCHGDDGEGNEALGAPNLQDNFWLYGGRIEDIEDSIWSGRQGVMPHWEHRLSEADRKVLSLYLLNKKGFDHD